MNVTAAKDSGMLFERIGFLDRRQSSISVPFECAVLVAL